MRVLLSGYEGSPNSVDQMVLMTDGIDMRALIEGCLTHYDADKMFVQYEYLRGWHIKFLYDIVKRSVIEEKKIHLDRSIVEKICQTLHAYKNLKIKFHEQEHRESGPLWRTGTDFYRWNPADVIHRFYRMYFNDGAETDLSTAYEIDTGAGFNVFVDGKKMTPAVAKQEA